MIKNKMKFWRDFGDSLTYTHESPGVCTSSMIDIRHLIRPKCLVDLSEDYTVVPAKPATGVLYITKRNPSFISGHLRMRGRSNGRYPYGYLEMINEVFGPEENAIEVCSNSISNSDAKFTVDINPDYQPNLVCNGEKLEGIAANTFDRWRCDPPYNEKTAREMYKTSLPNTHRLLQAGAENNQTQIIDVLVVRS